ncbi:hypothetical protein KJ865_14340 [Myxococcota bacterium]|nr:hypothetical protein [Myxococcota bacterium]
MTSPTNPPTNPESQIPGPHPTGLSHEKIRRQVFWFRLGALIFWVFSFTAGLSHAMRTHGLTPFACGYGMGTAAGPLIAAFIARLFKKEDPRFFWQILLAASLVAMVSNTGTLFNGI